MKKELQIFENRSDDWLAKERKYEESISVWDLYEAKKIKSYHEKNCEANRIKTEHEIKHSSYKQNRNSNTQFTDLNNKTIKTIATTIVIVVLVITLVFMLIASNVTNIETFMAVPIVLFIIGANIANSKKGKY